ALACFSHCPRALRYLHSFPTRRSSDLRPFVIGLERGGQFGSLVAQRLGEGAGDPAGVRGPQRVVPERVVLDRGRQLLDPGGLVRSEEHTSELQSRENLVCRLLLEKKKR